MNKDSNLFSVYRKPIKNVIPFKEVTTKDVFQVITSDKYKPVTEKLRSSNGQSREIKATEFDYATFSGTFSKREDAALIKHSGLICMDVDHIPNISDAKAQILNDFIPELMFISPSGDGLKVVYRINIEQGSHLEYFKALQVYFKRQFNISIDSSGKDISRACFLPYDPDCYYSDAPSVLDISFIDTFQVEVFEEKTDGSQHITDFNEIYSRLKIWVEKGVTFAQGSRNKYITKFAGALNRYGVPQEFALAELKNFEQVDFTQQEIEATVNSIYRKHTYFNISHFEISSFKKSTNEKKQKKVAAVAVPLLPIDGLPIFLKTLIVECSLVYGTHRDFWAGSFLAATALAIGQRYQLKGKYDNSAILWLANVAPSGIGKTEPLNIAFRPFHKIDGESIKAYENELKEYDKAKRNAKKEHTETLPDLPKCKQSILSDTTPEAVIVANQNNTNGILILRDELHGWLLDFGRYAKSGEVQNWLSSWSLQPMTVNRKGSSPIKLQNPFINICGGLQPEIIPELAKDHRAINGFMQRFCFVFPDDVQRPEYRSTELSGKIVSKYNEYINNLLSLTGHCEDVHLSIEAQGLYEAFVNTNAKAINNEHIGYIRALYSKLDIISLRLALIIHLSKWASTSIDEQDITPETMQTAIGITEYFRATGLKVYSYLTATNFGMNPKTVAHYLDGLGASQNEIAAALKVSQPYINKILNE